MEGRQLLLEAEMVMSRTDGEAPSLPSLKHFLWSMLAPDTYRKPTPWQWWPAHPGSAVDPVTHVSLNTSLVPLWWW